METKIWINQDCDIGFSISVQREIKNESEREYKSIGVQNIPLPNKITSLIYMFSYDELVELRNTLIREIPV
jgi:hypothetical protein